MALREIRASWQRLLVLLRLHCDRRGGDHRAAFGDPERAHRHCRARRRSLLAADMLLTSNRDFTPKVLDTLAAEQRAGRVTAACRKRPRFRRWSGRRIRRRSCTRMVELRAVQSGFPFYGTLTLANGTYSHDLLQESRRHRAAGTARAARSQGRRPHPDRHTVPFEIRGVIAVGAGTEPWRVQPRSARHHRLRRAGRHGAAVVRQPRFASAAAAGSAAGA